jgi:hypothetical protein
VLPEESSLLLPTPGEEAWPDQVVRIQVGHQYVSPPRHPAPLQPPRQECEFSAGEAPARRGTGGTVLLLAGSSTLDSPRTGAVQWPRMASESQVSWSQTLRMNVQFGGLGSSGWGWGGLRHSKRPSSRKTHPPTQGALCGLPLGGLLARSSDRHTVGHWPSQRPGRRT